MSDNVKSIVCPNCGSIDVSIEKNDVAKCHSCGGQFIINVDDNMLKMMKQIKRLNKNPEKNFMDGYKYNESFTKKDFINQVLLIIKDDTKSPDYIFDEMTLNDVNTIYVPIYFADGRADINYSRTIGYDRVEQWVETKITKYSDGTQKREPSYKSRTVTDWHPDSGMLTGDTTVNDYEDKYDIFKAVINKESRDENNISPLTDDEIDSFEVNPDIIARIKNKMINRIFENNISYPGSHVKDEYYSGTAKINNLSVLAYPIYTLEINIRDKTLIFYACPNGEMDIHMTGEYPLEDDLDEYFRNTRAFGEERKALTKKPKRISRLSLFLGLALFITFIVLGSNFDLTFLYFIGIPFLIAGIIVYGIFHSKVKKLDKMVGSKVFKFNKEWYERKAKKKEESYNNLINRI